MCINICCLVPVKQALLSLGLDSVVCWNFLKYLLIYNIYFIKNLWWRLIEEMRQSYDVYINNGKSLNDYS